MSLRREQLRVWLVPTVVLLVVVGVFPALPRLPGMPAQIALGLVGTTTRISVSSSGTQGNAESRGGSVAPDGQIAAFWSTASNLVAGDTNAVADVFVYDIATGTTTRVSVGQSGAEANGASISPSVSGDGRYVVFQSAATNLVASDTNAHQDIFLFDRQTTTTELVSVTTTGAQSDGDSFAGDVTPDGRYVAFWSGGTLDPDIGAGAIQVFVRDRQLGTTRAASVSSSGFGAGSTVSSPSISDDGRFVAFSTSASNLVPNDTNGLGDVFVRDMVNATTVRVSVGPAGVQGNGTSRRSAISGNGRFVAFESGASNLVGDDTNGAVDMFVYDTFAATTTRISLSSSGAQGDGLSIARDHDSSSRFISRDGRYVVFRSFATNFGGPFGALYVRDTQIGATTVVSAATEGNQDTGLNGAVSSGGRYVVFESDSAVLVPSDTNAVRDAFLRDTQGVASDFGSGMGFALGADPNAAISRDPVNLATGNFIAHADDLVLPGRGLPFAFTRWYNSADTNTGPLGPAWTHSYSWTLTDSGATVELRRGDGRRDIFTRNPDGTYADPPNVFDVLVKNGDGSFTLSLTSQIQYEFTAAGQLTRLHEPAGNQLTLTYTGANLTGITDTVGRQITLTYNGSNLTQLQDPLGRKVTYAYDANGRLSTVTDKIGNAPGQDPALHRWTYAYDGTTRHITTITDPDGRVRVTNTYDGQGRVYQQRDGLNALTQMSYSTGQTVLTDPRLHATTYTFDSRMRVLTQVDTVGANTYTISYVYDAAGNRTSVTDRNGKTTDFTYDARSNVLTKTDPQIDPQTPRYLTQFVYDTKNNLTLITDARGFATTLTYEPTSNVILNVSRQVDGTANALTKYEYTDVANPGLPTKVIAPRGNTGPNPNYTFATSLSYDAQGNLTQRIDPDGAKTTFAYDGAGRLASFVDPDGYAPGANPLEHTWSVGYDENDREKTRTDPMGNVLGYGYDGAGNRTTLTDRRGNITTYAYDANTRLATVQQKPDPVGQPTLVYTTAVTTRDGNGNATRITQANGVATDYAFDALDRLSSVSTHPDAQTTLTTSYVLDGNGQSTSRTTGDNVTVNYTYDALSRLSTVSGPSLSISYAYDATSQRTQMIDATGTTTYLYDGLGRATQVAAPGGTLTYAYDLDGNRTTLGYPGSQNVTYAYSPGGRLNTVTDWASRLSTYTYKASGLVSTLSYPNTMLASYSYDRAQRLTQITNAVGATTITQHTYTLDAEGNRTALDEYIQGITQPVQTWSASVQVNSVATGQQDRPRIALGPDGGTYLIWDDYRTGGQGDIYFSRRDPVSGTWGTNQKVNDDVNGGTQYYAAIAVDGSNNAYAAWVDPRQGTIKNPDNNVFFSKRSASTGLWGTNVRVNDDTSGRAVQGAPRIAVKSAGDAVAVWDDHRSNQWNVYSSRLPAGSNTWAANMRVTDNTVSRKFTPDVVVGADGTAYAVWEDDRSGNSDIWFSTLPAGTSVWTANVKISDDPGTAAQYDPQIGISAAGDLIVIWQDDRVAGTQVRMRRRLTGQSNWEASIVASDAAARPVSLALGVRSDGNAFAAWQDARGSSYDIWGADYTFATNSWTTSALVSDDPGNTAQMRPAAALSASEVAVVWRDDRVTGGDIRARRRIATQGTDHFTYAFDGLNRLLSSTGAISESFVLDGATNLTSRTGPSATYGYDSANRLLSDGSQTFVWSPADRMVHRGSDEFTFDALARLTSSTVAGTPRTYTYDGDGLLKTAATVAYLWDTTAAPAPLVQAGADKVIYGLAPLYGARSDGSTYTFASDGLGSVRAEVGDTSAVNGSFRYAAYGSIAAASPSGRIPTLLGFAGALRDTSGLTYLRARWYDPGLSRFISSDPYAGAVALPSSLNSFGYGQGRPALLTDPLGLDPGSQARSNWAYDVANVFRDLDSSDRMTQLAALAKISVAALLFAIPVGIAATPTVVTVGGAAAVSAQGAIAAALAPRVIAYAAGTPVVIKVSHVLSRHISPSSLQALTAAVEEDVNAILSTYPSAQSWIGWVQMAGQWFQYRAYYMGTYVSVGTVYPVSGLLSNLR